MGIEGDGDMMEEYINRLIRCGYSPCDAYLTYHQFLKEHGFSHKELDEFLSSLEEKERGEIHVDRI